jgi:hypothetical protein
LLSIKQEVEKIKVLNLKYRIRNKMYRNNKYPSTSLRVTVRLSEVEVWFHLVNDNESYFPVISKLRIV